MGMMILLPLLSPHPLVLVLAPALAFALSGPRPCSCPGLYPFHASTHARTHVLTRLRIRAFVLSLAFLCVWLFAGKLFHSGLPHKAVNALELCNAACAELQNRFYKAVPPCDEARMSADAPSNERFSFACMPFAFR
eukprot:628481-Pleurochrysis_carterae.AAC.1